jgi:hypothetical protein
MAQVTLYPTKNSQYQAKRIPTNITLPNHKKKKKFYLKGSMSMLRVAPFVFAFS